MDLAADAALGTGNNIATAGGALGPGGGATAAGGATQFGGGYDFGSGTGATFGGQGGAGVDALGTGIPAGTTMPSLASASPATVSALQTAAQQAGKTLQEFATSPSGIKLLVAGAGAALAGGAASGGSGGGSGIGDQTGIAAQQAALGTSMVDWNKERYAAGQPTRDAATAGALTAQTGQLATQASQDAAATDTRNFAGTTLRPLESKMATDALGYDTAGRRADATAAAASDVEQSYAASNEANNRDMLRTGVTPGSGRMQSLMADQAIAKANARAAATTGAVRNVEATGAQRVSDAQKALQYLPGEATTEANSGVAAGTAAANSGTNAVASQGAGITNVNAGYTGAISANNSAGNLYNQAATLADKQYGQIGDAVGNYLSSDNGQKNLGDLANWISDKKLKKGTGKKADGEKALAQINATPVEDGWKYDPKKGGPDDGGKKHIGPMAQQVRRTMGEHVAPGGKEISPMDMNGKLMAGMQALTKRIGKLEARVA
ncbi:MAG TPA: hypothetical protein VNU71_03450, partial [Burkholderiaceae bacterium]|nr:hypothetical protein [Burkholderiaceae bacterium]